MLLGSRKTGESDLHPIVCRELSTCTRAGIGSRGHRYNEEGMPLAGSLLFMQRRPSARKMENKINFIQRVHRHKKANCTFSPSQPERTRKPNSGIRWTQLVPPFMRGARPPWLRILTWSCRPSGVIMKFSSVTLTLTSGR